MKDYNKKNYKSNISDLSTGDKVLLVSLPDSLLKDLPDEDQEAIKAQKGKTFVISSIDRDGLAEIDFEYERPDLEVTFHTIWVDLNCLIKTM